jgi:hypothetical protein
VILSLVWGPGGRRFEFFCARSKQAPQLLLTLSPFSLMAAFSGGYRFVFSSAMMCLKYFMVMIFYPGSQGLPP